MRVLIEKKWEPENQKKSLQEDSDDTGNDFAFGKTCDDTENPRRERDDCKNQADDPTKTKIVILFCHNFCPPIFLAFALTLL